MKSLISILLTSILLAKFAEAAQKPIVIAVVDTGYSQASYAPSPRFCRFGHADLSGSDLNLHKIPEDNNGHGTHIVHTIEKQLLNAPEGSYCIVVLKYFDTSAKSSEQQNIKNSIAAFNLATKMRVDFVNYSSAGEKADPSEELAVKKCLI